MLYTPLHNKWLRLITASVGTALMAVGLNLFIVPLHLYPGGLMGVCQLLRTLFLSELGVSFGTMDIAGVLYLLLNIPVMLIGYRHLGRRMTFRIIFGVASYTFFCSVIPVAEKSLVEDTLTGCLLGGIITGSGSGLVLTCGCSTGGTDIIGLALSKTGKITVGQFCMGFNVVLYTICFLIFSPEVAIYSIIYNFTSSMMVDRFHQQNVSVQALIFTHEDQRELAGFIMEKLGRGVTYWEGVGAYTGQGIHVLCVTLSRFEIEELRHAVRKMDPHAFITVQRGVQVIGNFAHRVGD